MSDTAAAMRAAKEVQADTLAPELFRQASEWFFKAKREYKFKNFKLAQEYSEKARRFAEQAEFEAIRNGGNRSDVPPDPYGNSDAPPPPPGAGAVGEPYQYPTPEGTPAEAFEQRRQQEEAAKKSAQPPASQLPTSPPPPTPLP